MKKRVFVAGHQGMVGSAIVRALEKARDAEIITRTRSELDLLDQAAVFRFLTKMPLMKCIWRRQKWAEFGRTILILPNSFIKT